MYAAMCQIHYTGTDSTKTEPALTALSTSFVMESCFKSTCVTLSFDNSHQKIWPEEGI